MGTVNKQLLDALKLAEPHLKYFEVWCAANQAIAAAEKEMHAEQAPQATVPVPTIKLGIYGKAFDSTQTCRAYTYREQPDNMGAGKIGRAAASTSLGGDNIDRGLSLLQQLQAQGFGVFELGEQQEGSAA